MSLFRGRAKIFGQIRCRDITIPRSTSTPADKIGTCFNHSIAEVRCLRNAEDTHVKDGQKTQITPSRSLFSLFRKKGSMDQDDLTNTTLQQRKDETWLTKMFAKPSKPLTPQERCLIKTREMQKKLEVGFVRIQQPNWEPSVRIVTKESSVPKQKLSGNQAPPPTLQPVPPPSVEARLMELHEKHNTSPQLTGKEVDFERYVPKLPYSEFKPQPKEIPEKFYMEKYEDKRSTAKDEVGERKRSTSANGLRMERNFSWFTQTYAKRTEPSYASSQPIKALIHTGRKNIQYFNHRNYVESQKLTKVKGHSLQAQVNKRKYILAQMQNTSTSNVLPSINLKVDKKSNISELPPVNFRAKSITDVQKVTGKLDLRFRMEKSKEKLNIKGKASKNKVPITAIKKSNSLNEEVKHTGYSSKVKGSVSCDATCMSRSSPTDLASTSNKMSESLNPTHAEIVASQKTKKEFRSSKHTDKEQSKKLVPKLQLRKWMKKVKERERMLGSVQNDGKTLQTSLESKHEHGDARFMNNSPISNDEVLQTPNQDKLKTKINSKTTKKLDASKPAIYSPKILVKEHALPSSSNVHANLVTPKKPQWKNLTSYSKVKANKSVAQRKLKNNQENIVSQMPKVHIANSLQTLQKLMSSQIHHLETQNNSPKIRDLLAQNQMKNLGNTPQKIPFNVASKYSISKPANKPEEKTEVNEQTTVKLRNLSYNKIQQQLLTRKESTSTKNMNMLRDQHIIQKNNSQNLTDKEQKEEQVADSNALSKITKNSGQNKNVVLKATDQVNHLEESNEPVKTQEAQSNAEIFDNYSKEDAIKDGETQAFTSTSAADSDIANNLDQQTECLKELNFDQNSTSQLQSHPKIIYETIPLKSSHDILPVETYNTIMNKNWTFADYAAYFYGAIFSKHDLLSMHLHKILGNNDKEYQPSLLENTITNIPTKTINDMQSKPIVTSTEETLSGQDSNNKSENITTIKNEETWIKATNLDNEGSSDETITNKITITNLEMIKDTENNLVLSTRDEGTVNSLKNASTTAKPSSSTNSSITPIQYSSKRSYSSWGIREPFNPNQSAYECKCKNRKKKDKKKKDTRNPMPLDQPRQLVCEKKEKVETCKKIHLPGCRLPSISGCSDDQIEALPCIKKEAPQPSFSECLKYPLKKPRLSECDCHAPKYGKCKNLYMPPRNYDACKKKPDRRPRKKKDEEEELDDDDEGQFPC